MALLIVFPYGYGLDEMTGYVSDEVAPVYIVLGHKRIEYVLLTPEQFLD